MCLISAGGARAAWIKKFFRLPLDYWSALADITKTVS
jgi:hypothetical protein